MINIRSKQTHTVMYEFCYDYEKPKHSEKAKLCYMETNCFTVHVKADDIYKSIREDVETRYDTSNYELNRPLPKENNKKVIGVIKDELDGENHKRYVELRAKS